MDIDWNDPAARARLIEAVGVEEYNKAHEAHRKRSTVAVVNGHAIRPIVSSRFGRIFMVGNTGKGHGTLEGARQMATEAPKGDA